MAPRLEIAPEHKSCRLCAGQHLGAPAQAAWLRYSNKQGFGREPVSPVLANTRCGPSTRRSPGAAKMNAASIDPQGPIATTNGIGFRFRRRRQSPGWLEGVVSNSIYADRREQSAHERARAGGSWRRVNGSWMETAPVLYANRVLDTFTVDRPAMPAVCVCASGEGSRHKPP